MKIPTISAEEADAIDAEKDTLIDQRLKWMKSNVALSSAMSEDEEMRRPATFIGRLKEDSGIEPHEDLPKREERK